MFKCRVCSIVPFASFLGLFESDDDDENKHVRKSGGSDCDSTPSAIASETPHSVAESEVERDRRSAEEVAYLVKSWDTYVHERAKAMYKTPAKRYSILASIAKGCGRADDPILGNDVACVRWYGDTEDGNPVISYSSTGDAKGKITYVTRMMVFLFADQQSYEIIDKAGCRSFKMACGNRWCINLTHISLA
ncbi:hypothetical protein, conserved [Babesia bigemina]|uniref:Uncharacterized protein n=1 Tax=Babesia bigemina TaxID=5866 RepID=A0A061D825_BABBI|nr:hypothetical protein, conserved [Babesia bigemina]CDR93870.1 hypothetical protein, conserved [Babesia bigemina]|eukprot:XP_012766056.1 hypothetical protein, conserved [Babesia bigemina]